MNFANSACAETRLAKAQHPFGTCRNRFTEVQTPFGTRRRNLRTPDPVKIYLLKISVI